MGKSKAAAQAQATTKAKPAAAAPVKEKSKLPLLLLPSLPSRAIRPLKTPLARMRHPSPQPRQMAPLQGGYQGCYQGR
ncbi:hypothetical protein AG1IA_06272 [Rhizoctonia solani AG-1 IA]|uniref:Uncharacterized protein n=1 Tax=Thanatephorus cucumeris (strain AG1-IA) TaxID=983506 RepID=L8WNZ1_THACA|nr:hypothetical protein AG1IA_06272 [Rhizoctonia solani AG-1 IA]